MSTKSESNSQQTLAELTAELVRQKTIIEQLRVRDNGGVKIPPPDTYSGGRGKLQTFLTQANTYVRYYGKTLTNNYDKIMCISRYLGGNMADWFEPHQREWLEKKEKDWQSSLSKDEQNLTDQMFKNYTNFEKELKKLFGGIDEERLAE